MNVIDFLNQYRRCWYEAIKATKELDELEQSLGLQSKGNDGLPRSTKKSDPTADMAIHLADLSMSVRQKSLTAKLKTAEIQRAIDKSMLTDTEYSVIHERYMTMPQGTIRQPSWSDIAITLRYSMQHCKNTHHNALLKIADMNKLEVSTKQYDNEEE